MKELNKEEMLKVEGGSSSRPQDDGFRQPDVEGEDERTKTHNHPEDSTTCYYCNTSPHLA